MSMYGDDWEYANSRLEQTIVQYESLPIFVQNIKRDMVAVCRTLGSTKWKEVDARLLDCKPVKLGYCNRKGETSYLMRMPMRRDWRQGLRQGNFTARGMFGAEYVEEIDLGKVITGQYPSLEECIKSVGKASYSMAWCREWAITQEGSKSIIEHKSRPVGILLNGVPTLNEESNYLRQALEEVL